MSRQRQVNTWNNVYVVRDGETTANFRFATAQVRSALAVVNDAGTIKLWGGKAASCRVSPESTVP